MLFHTSFLDQDKIPHVLPEKKKNHSKQWLRPLMQCDRIASSSSRILLLGMKFSWPSQTHHESRSIKTVSRLWHSKINY